MRAALILGWNTAPIISDVATHLADGVRGIALDDAAAVASLAVLRPADLLLDTIGGQGLSQRIGWVRPEGKAVCVGYAAGAGLPIDIPK